ncbi:TonB-dependent receptor [Inquilinus sp. KBS0705]|nr:TonB-dependent receptor [Inquilinus sp. KBS0705]
MKKLFLMLLALCSLQLQLSAQTTPAALKSGVDVKDIISKLQSLSTDRVIEKAYLHFDKPYYDPGDTLYFKAYVTAGEKHELSTISGVLHVDLISKNDSVMQSIVLRLTNGQANGDFLLPAYLTKGNYKVRAYTQWMQNNGNTYFFTKQIPVTGKNLTRVAAPAKADKRVDVQFFPEGGSFVTNLPSKIAFKAVGSDGLGVNIKGVVVDNENTEVAKITSAHLGMGQFFVTPAANKTYTAKITYPDGSVNKVDLPAPSAKGIALAVNNDNPDKISVEVNANKAYYLENKNQDINIVIYNGGVVKTVKTVLDNQVIGFDLPVKDMKTGIVQVTLFSQSGAPLNERLAFIQNSGILNLTVNSDKAAYAHNDKATISLNAKAGVNPAAGNFSVSVVDETKVPFDENMERSILSDLLLTSDVKGYVEQPGYYFVNNTADTRSNLDVLMLTQGYRRFVWSDMMDSKPATIAYQPENALQIKGAMLTNDGKPVANEKITLLANNGQSLTAVTDAGGKFIFKDLGFDNNTRFLLKTENQAIKSKTKIVVEKSINRLAVDADVSPMGKYADNLPVNNVADESTVVSNADNAKELKPVLVKDSKTNYRSSNLGGSGNADQVIKHDEFKDSPTLIDGLNGKVRGVKFSNGAAYLLNGLVISAGAAKYEPMLIVVDGNTGGGSLANYNPNDIETVEILKGNNAAIYGVAGGAGVIVLTTRQGGGDDAGDAVHVMSPGLISITPQGFYKAREFYSPVYNITDREVNTNRTTILWKPNLVTDKDGNTTFSYFNGATPGNYRVVIEGIDSNGNLGHSVYKYKVQ